jgi:uncharacterized RDD family membrane protein YckC
MTSAGTSRAQRLAAARAAAGDGDGAAAREAVAMAAPAARRVPVHAGLATRAVAMALDAAAINAVALGVGGVVALCTSLLHLPSTVEQVVALVGAGAWLAWAAGWFVVFWSTTGQTPGDRVMRIRVRDARDAHDAREARDAHDAARPLGDGDAAHGARDGGAARDAERPIGHARALLRLVALVLGAVPLFAGYLLVLVDGRRRAFHDVVAHTVVVHDRAPEPAAAQPAAPAQRAPAATAAAPSGYAPPVAPEPSRGEA